MLPRTQENLKCPTFVLQDAMSSYTTFVQCMHAKDCSCYITLETRQWCHKTIKKFKQNLLTVRQKKTWSTVNSRGPMFPSIKTANVRVANSIVKHKGPTEGTRSDHSRLPQGALGHSRDAQIWRTVENCTQIKYPALEQSRGFILPLYILSLAVIRRKSMDNCHYNIPQTYPHNTAIFTANYGKYRALLK